MLLGGVVGGGVLVGRAAFGDASAVGVAPLGGPFGGCASGIERAGGASV